MQTLYSPKHMMISAACLVCLWSAPAGAEEFEIEDGFVPMFNGKDFSGWQFDQNYSLPDKPPENWKVEDGVIKLSGGGRPYLGSQWDYDDFDMRFQWRAMREEYNSGFFIRSNRKVGNNQINLAKGGEGRFLGGKMQGGKPVPELQKPATEWNDWRVLVVGGTVSFWCNGELAWEGTEFESKQGHNGLQAEGAPMEFRHLRIEELGWESLSDRQKWPRTTDDHWQAGGYGLVFAPTGIARVKPEQDYEDYIVRLEWSAQEPVPGDIGIINGNKLTMVHLADPNGLVVDGAHPGATTDNPPGQWNYLQLTFKDDKLTVWQNGSELVKGFDTTSGLGVDGGFLIVRANKAGLQMRNMRIKAVQP